DSQVRAVVDQIVRRPIADAVEVDAAGISPPRAGEVLDVIVHREITGRRKFYAVASRDVDPHAAKLLQVAADNAIPLAAMDADADASQVPQRAAFHAIILAAFNVHAGAATVLDNQAVKNYVRRVTQLHDRAFQHGKLNGGMFESLGRPE